MLVVPLFFIFIKFNHIETIWLNLHKARALNCIGEHLQSFAIAIDVAKQKTGDYWAWELLGLGVTGRYSITYRSKQVFKLLLPCLIFKP
ncbi:MAG: hypothetical protein ACI88H_001439 [Cocleimonas sp.]|jgi:hypothetical protein